MATNRQELIGELARLVRTAKAREVYVRLDDAELAKAVDRLERQSQQSRAAGGSMSADDFGLRVTPSTH